MSSVNALRIPAVAFAASLALAIPGCAGPAPQAREGAVTVSKVERVRWDLPPEPGIFRVRFDAAIAGEIRQQAERVAGSSDMDYYYAEIRVIEQEAGRELKARGLCPGSAKLVSPVESGDGKSGIGALFRCQVPLFRD
ncbi:MAG TPA: hypothetical protein VFV55_00470 [Usitatibacteraceae bacterium]|nr:hypothetical protein [Usitatibacteraceae bacterium]